MSLVGINTPEEEDQANAGRMSFQIIETSAMNRKFLHENTALGLALKSIKYKVGENLCNQTQTFISMIK